MDNCMKKYIVVVFENARGQLNIESCEVYSDTSAHEALINNTPEEFLEEADMLTGETNQITEGGMGDGTIYGEEWTAVVFAVPEGVDRMIVCDSFDPDDIFDSLLTLEGFDAECEEHCIEDNFIEVNAVVYMSVDVS